MSNGIQHFIDILPLLVV